MTDKKIMYESAEAATFKTDISGWVSSDGRFFGNDEHAARYAGSTHKICECGNEHERGWTKCEECRAKYAQEKYLERPYQVYDFVTPVYCDERYFFNSDEIVDFMVDNNLTTLDLEICEPVTAPYIDDYAVDELPEDWALEDADKELSAMIDKINEYILKKQPILSWYPSKYRTTVYICDQDGELKSTPQGEEK